MPRPRVSRRSEVHLGLGADRVRGRSLLPFQVWHLSRVRLPWCPQSLPKPGTKAGFEEADLSAVCEKPVELTQRVPHLRGASVGSVRMMTWVYLLPLQHFPRSLRGIQPCCLERTHPPTHP